MKYHTEWLIIGFGLFWLIELVAFFNGVCSHPNPLFEYLLPFIMWGCASMLEFQREQRDKAQEKEFIRKWKKEQRAKEKSK